MAFGLEIPQKGRFYVQGIKCPYAEALLIFKLYLCILIKHSTIHLVEISL